MMRFRVALLAGLAGSLVIAGALLPWVSMFAGLERFPGTTGVYGRVLLAGGIALLLLAIAELWRWTDVVRWTTGLLGGLLLLPAGLAILGQREIASMDPMLVAAAGPGPWVAAAGASVALVALFVPPHPSDGAGATEGGSHRDSLGDVSRQQERDPAVDVRGEQAGGSLPPATFDLLAVRSPRDGW